MKAKKPEQSEHDTRPTIEDTLRAAEIKCAFLALLTTVFSSKADDLDLAPDLQSDAWSYIQDICAEAYDEIGAALLALPFEASKVRVGKDGAE